MGWVIQETTISYIKVGVDIDSTYLIYSQLNHFYLILFLFALHGGENLKTFALIDGYIQQKSHFGFWAMAYVTLCCESNCLQIFHDIMFNSMPGLHSDLLVITISVFNRWVNMAYQVCLYRYWPEVNNILHQMRLKLMKWIEVGFQLPTFDVKISE